MYSQSQTANKHEYWSAHVMALRSRRIKFVQKKAFEIIEGNVIELENITVDVTSKHQKTSKYSQTQKQSIESQRE